MGDIADPRWKALLNEAILILSNAAIDDLAITVPVLFNEDKNTEIEAQQNEIVAQSGYDDSFKLLKPIFHYINPVYMTLFNTDALRFAITINAYPTVYTSHEQPITTILLLQDEFLPALIKFLHNKYTFEDVLTTIDSNLENKTTDIYEFPFLDVDYIVIIKSKAHREIFLNYHNLLIDNQPTFFNTMIDFTKVLVKILEASDHLGVDPRSLTPLRPFDPWYLTRDITIKTIQPAGENSYETQYFIKQEENIDPPYSNYLDLFRESLYSSD